MNISGEDHPAYVHFSVYPEIGIWVVNITPGV
jgi:hypothetical protein